MTAAVDQTTAREGSPTKTAIRHRSPPSSSDPGGRHPEPSAVVADDHDVVAAGHRPAGDLDIGTDDHHGAHLVPR